MKKSSHRDLRKLFRWPNANCKWKNDDGPLRNVDGKSNRNRIIQVRKYYFNWDGKSQLIITNFGQWCEEAIAHQRWIPFYAWTFRG